MALAKKENLRGTLNVQRLNVRNCALYLRPHDSPKQPHRHSSLEILLRITRLLTLVLIIVVAFGALAISSARNEEVALANPLTLKWRYSSDQTSNFTPATDMATV